MHTCCHHPYVLPKFVVDGLATGNDRNQIPCAGRDVHPGGWPRLVTLYHGEPRASVA